MCSRLFCASGRVFRVSSYRFGHVFVNSCHAILLSPLCGWKWGLLIHYVFFGVAFVCMYKSCGFFFKFIYFWLCWVSVAARRLSLVEASGVYSSLQCTGFSLRWLLLLQSMGSRRAGFRSCGMQAQ